MGFLKFLNKKPRDYKGHLEELDLPPAPPPLEDFDSGLPDIPDTDAPIKDDFGIPDIDDNFPNLSGDEFKGSMPDDFNKSSPLDDLPELPPLVSPRELPIALPAPTPSQKYYPNKKYPQRKRIYVDLEHFKDVLRGINSIRANIKGLEHTFKRVDDAEITKDRLLNSLSKSMHDLQKRLVYIDKKLLGGGD